MPNQAPTSFSAVTQSKELKLNKVEADKLKEFSPTNENLKNIDMAGASRSGTSVENVQQTSLSPINK